MKSIPNHSSPNRGFTLIELLTVIAIIGILAAILIPTVGRVRDSARDTRCRSNLRQIGLAAHIYANDHGFLPASLSPAPVRPWPQEMREYLGGTNPESADFWRNSDVIVCPSRTIESNDGNRPSYSAHPRLMPDLLENSSRPRWSPEMVVRPTQVILFGDATQQAHGGSHSNYWSINPMRGDGSPDNGDNYIDSGPDTDGGSPGHFRFRHNGRMNAVFVDGHVDSFEKGRVRELNVRLNY